MEVKDIRKALPQFKKKHVLVVGDLMLDQYTFGEVYRISPEAPVAILRKTDEKFVPGGAGNVAANVAALGAHAVLMGVVGNDYYKDMLFSTLEELGIATGRILVHKRKPTILKHRYVAGNNHQLLRVDIEETEELESNIQQELLSNVEKELKKVDIVILADYAKGIFSQWLTPKIIALAKKSKKRIIADAKPQNKMVFQGVDVVTPNIKEAEEMADTTDQVEIGKRLIAFFGGDVLVTKAQEGMTVFKRNGKSKDLPTRKIKVFDVSGAGDTVVSVIALGLASGLDIEDAAMLANYAGGIVVQKPGTATISVEELTFILEDDHHLESIDIVPKVWGYEKWLENNPKYCSKLLFLREGYQCSLHYHKVKDEMFLVTKGHVRLELGKKIFHMRAGNFVRVLPETPHRFRGIEDTEILEVSTHHREEDSYRLEESRKVDEKAK